MENYFVRIYQSDERYPDNLLGLVEEIRTKEIKAFQTVEELGRILKENRSRRTKKTRSEKAHRVI